MASERNNVQNDDSNSPLLTSKDKVQKSIKHRRKLVKKFSNEKAPPVESSSPVSIKKKTPNSLKPKGKIVKKSSNESCKLGENNSPSKEKTPTSQNTKNKFVNEKPIASSSKEVQNSEIVDKKPKSENTKETQKHEGEKKGFHSGKVKEVIHDRNKDMKKLGGFIFMCNGKTKGDCYRYRVMGVQAHKKDLVMGIKRGMKLFLFDFDVKLLYGIYNASSAGGMKLEPAAFGGAFPLQVRFEVYKDCLPLPESVFKKAIKESYDERTHKFKTELTIDQVRRLTNLFKPAPFLHSNPQPIIHQPRRPEQENIQFPNSTLTSPSLLLTEQEYRNYGLRGERHNNLTPAPPAYDPYRPGQEREAARHDPVILTRPPEQETIRFHNPNVVSPMTQQDYTSYGLAYDPYRIGQEREAARPDSVTLSGQEYTRPDTLFLSEKDYRTYGLKGRHENPNVDTISHSALGLYQSDPYPSYEPTSSLVERYLPQPLAAHPSSSYQYESMENEGRFRQENVLSDRVERLFSVNDQHNIGQSEYRSGASVSSRYAFASPSVIHR